MRKATLTERSVAFLLLKSATSTVAKPESNLKRWQNRGRRGPPSRGRRVGCADTGFWKLFPEKTGLGVPVRPVFYTVSFQQALQAG